MKGYLKASSILCYSSSILHILCYSSTILRNILRINFNITLCSNDILCSNITLCSISILCNNSILFNIFRSNRSKSILCILSSNSILCGINILSSSGILCNNLSSSSILSLLPAFVWIVTARSASF